MKIRILPLIAFVYLFSACAAPTLSAPQPIGTRVPTMEATSTPEPTLPPIQTESSPTTENMPVTGMTTYTDDFAGFSLAYPADWFLEASALTHAQESFAYSVSVHPGIFFTLPRPLIKTPTSFLPEAQRSM